MGPKRPQVDLRAERVPLWDRLRTRTHTDGSNSVHRWDSAQLPPSSAATRPQQMGGQKRLRQRSSWRAEQAAPARPRRDEEKLVLPLADLDEPVDWALVQRADLLVEGDVPYRRRFLELFEHFRVTLLILNELMFWYAGEVFFYSFLLGDSFLWTNVVSYTTLGFAKFEITLPNWLALILVGFSLNIRCAPFAWTTRSIPRITRCGHVCKICRVE